VKVIIFYRQTKIAKIEFIKLSKDVNILIKNQKDNYVCNMNEIESIMCNLYSVLDDLNELYEYTKTNYNNAFMS
jgi:hypothetical protein